MKPVIESQRQWLWFIALCGGGLTATLLLAYVARVILTIL